MMTLQPRYPIYIPSKGRADHFSTAKMFDRDGVTYRVVVEPNEVSKYQAWADRLLILPENGQGLVYARNWIKDHAISEGHERHWQFDDDIRAMVRIWKGYRLECISNGAIAIAEEFVDRYENVALASFNSKFFMPHVNGMTHDRHPPFYLNARCYTCFLILNSIPNRWRRRYNEDTDMTLQVLATGWCTILFNAFLIDTPATMTQQGGQTDIYVNDGRLRMAKELERLWPGTVTVKRRFGRPQHIVKDAWRRFDTPLKKKPGIVIPQGIDEHGLILVTKQAIKNPKLKALVEAHDEHH